MIREFSSMTTIFVWLAVLACMIITARRTVEQALADQLLEQTAVAHVLARHCTQPSWLDFGGGCRKGYLLLHYLKQISPTGMD
jgi:hypothetical protein